MSGLTNNYYPSDYQLFDFRLTSNSSQLRTLAKNLVDDLSLKTGRWYNENVDLMVCMLANLVSGITSYIIKNDHFHGQTLTKIPFLTIMPSCYRKRVTTRPGF